MCHMWWPLILPYIFKVFWSIVRKFVIQLTHDVVTCYFPLQVQYPHVEAFGSPVTQISSMNILPVMALRYGPVTITLAMLTQCKGFPHLTRGGGGAFPLLMLILAHHLFCQPQGCQQGHPSPAAAPFWSVQAFVHHTKNCSFTGSK